MHPVLVRTQVEPESSQTPLSSSPAPSVSATTEEGPASGGGDSLLRDLVDSVDKLNAVLDGEPSSETPGEVVLDAAQFGALGIGLALIVALLAALLVSGMRR